MIKKTTGFEPNQTRYFYDFALLKKGFAQIDTSEDASYYGNWANAATFEMFSFVEGDTCHVKCDTASEFAQIMCEFVEFCASQGKDYFRGVDVGPNHAPEKLQPWKDAGLIHLTY
jgi:hypothetical protein